MFEEYVGRRLKQRHKAIGEKYARTHGYPEHIGDRSYGIDFKDWRKDGPCLIFHVRYDSEPVHDWRGKRIPGRSIKTVTEVFLEEMNCTSEEIAEAERIGRGYLELALEPEDTR